MTHVALLLFLAFAAITVLSAWAIVLSENIVRMAVYLLLTLGGVAGLYLLLNSQFLAAIQLIVYAGGTLILIVFGVMLTSGGTFVPLKIGKLERLASVLLAVVLAAVLMLATVLAPTMTQAPAIGDAQAAAAEPTVADIGKAILSDYLVPFEVAAVLLLVVMIAAAYMARRRAEGPQGQGPGE